MTQINNNTDFTNLLLHFTGMEDPMPAMLEWLCDQLMEAEVSLQISAGKHEQNKERKTSRSGYRTRRLDTRLGTAYLMVPKVRNGGCVPFFITEYQRSEAALIEVIQEAYVNGVSRRKMDRLAKSLGMEKLSKSQVSEMNQGLNE